MRFALVILAAYLAPAVCAALDVAIINGAVYDGTGRNPVRANIGVQGGRIVQVTPAPLQAKQVLDASGLAVAPGFIDVHTHAENIVYHAKAENFLRMGVTTLVLGNCGSSKLDIGKFFEQMSHVGFSPNLASLIGHGTVRNQVMSGSIRRPPTAAELQQMANYVDQAMKDGALGMSTGLIYLPGTFAKTEELVALSKIVSRHGGLYVSHMRNEGTNIFAAIDEVCTIGVQARVPVHISHLKLAGRTMWGKHDLLLARLDEARRDGLKLTQDQYGYTASSTSLRQLLPDAMVAGGATEFTRRIQDPKRHAETVAWMKHRLKSRGREDYSYAVIALHRKQPRYNGLNVVEAAKLRYGQTTLDHQIALIFEIEMNGGASAVFHGMSEADARAFMKHPRTMFASDSSVRVFKRGVPHPRGYGNAARFLGHYTRDHRQLKLEEAIRKLSDLPAKTFGLKGRGRLQAGYAADITVFNPATVKDNATFKEPHAYATGFRWVLVNGNIVIENDRHNESGPGQIIRRAQ